MLTYALGRGLEYYDRCAVDKILEALDKDDDRFSTLVWRWSRANRSRCEPRRGTSHDERRTDLEADGARGASARRWPCPGWRRCCRARLAAAGAAAGRRRGGWPSSTCPTAPSWPTGRRKTEGADFDLPAILEPLAPFQDDLLVLSGLTCDKARPNGDGGGDHARASSAFLTGCQARKTAGANFRSGDLGRPGRRRPARRPHPAPLARARHRALPRDRQLRQRLFLRLRAHDLLAVADLAAADRGRPPAGLRAPLLRAAQRPRPPQAEPAAGQRARRRPGRRPRPGQPARRRRPAEARPVPLLRPRAGAADRPRRDAAAGPAARPARSSRRACPADLSEHFRLMCDLLVLAFQADVTRVATCMFGREGSEQKYRMVGISEGHHELTHHRERPGQDRQGPHDQHLPHRAVRLPPRQAEVDPRGGRHPARQLHDRLRQRQQRRQPPHPRQPAGPAGRQGRRHASRPAGTSATRRRRR